MPSREVEEFMRLNVIKVQGDRPPCLALSWEELSVPPQVRAIIDSLGWIRPTPVQSMAIPVALAGRDLVAIAKTGSGKTGAFVLPGMIHITRQDPIVPGDGPIVLVLSPTRELAQQIAEVASSFCRALGIRSVCCFGGASRSGQIRELRQWPGMVVACPGRLVDFVESGSVSLDRVSFLVLDEADRMLDMGFEFQIRRIVEKLRSGRQTLMFSATWPKEIRKLAEDFLQGSIHIVIGDSELTTNANIKQIVEQVHEIDKLRRCVDYLAGHPRAKVLIFTRTKRAADDLAAALTARGMGAMAIHGDKPQQGRDLVLNRFKASQAGILVATDVASRGLDVTDIDTVVNFDFPQDIESYIHRIGRTARGTRSGVSLSYFTDESKPLARKLVKVMGQAQQEIPPWLGELASVMPRGSSRQAGFRCRPVGPPRGGPYRESGFRGYGGGYSLGGAGRYRFGD